MSDQANRSTPDADFTPANEPPLEASSVSWAYIAFALACVAGMFLLPRPYSMIALAVFAVGTPGIILGKRVYSIIYRQVSDKSITLPKIHPRFAATLEIALILVGIWIFTPQLRDFSPDQKLGGNEFSYLIKSGAVASVIFERTGAIPLWNPFMGSGEPLVTGPFSYIFNPFMTLPVLGWGIIQGTKIVTLLHLVLLAFGGWVLGHALRFGRAGRLLLAFLLLGNGSVAGAVGLGFYQMGLSQVYMPWVFAALLFILRHDIKGRWPVGLFALSSMLLVSAGTLWYALPTAITCVLLTLTHADRLRKQRFRLRRLIWAVLLTVGISAVRVLPLAVYHEYILHPPMWFKETHDFFTLLGHYFRPQSLVRFKHFGIEYHYTLPLGFAVFLLVIWLVTLRHKINFGLPWRIITVALVAIILFTAWAMEDTPAVRWLYETVPLLAEWRILGRMMAAASPWIAILAALIFDRVIRAITQQRRISFANAAVLVVTLLFAIIAVFDVMDNWDLAGMQADGGSLNRDPLYALREKEPQAMVSVGTESFFDYLPIYETLTRAAFGMPDYHAGAITSTLDAPAMADMPPQYTITYDDEQIRDLRRSGQKAIYTRVLWQNPAAPTYAFIVDAERLRARDPLKRADTQPVTTYVHNIDSIDVTLQSYPRGEFLIVQERAFPGWRVKIDGHDAPLESVNGLIGVKLPRGEVSPMPIQIVFSFFPEWLTRAGAITLISALIYAGYLLRVDQRLTIKLSRPGLSKPHLHLRLPSIPVLYLARHTLELSLIGAAVIAATHHLADFTATTRWTGLEFSYLVKSGAIAHEIFDRTGAIPLWNPFLGSGEPLVEGPFSYIFNPIMTAPMLALGAVQGAKVVILVHIGLLALGGWALGHMLRLRLPGRVLLALLLTGNGSVVAAISLGFYQMGLSQAYMPWVFVGLFGTLTQRARWPVGLFAVSFMLLISAGTLWYTLPTIIACMILVLAFASSHKLTKNIALRLIGAMFFAVALSAVRWLPLLLHQDYVWHPVMYFQDRIGLDTLLHRYVERPSWDDYTSYGIIYHYVLPPLFVGLLIVGRLIAGRARNMPAQRWIIAASVVLIGIFTIWAMENIPPVRWLYSIIPALGDWRILGRMLAAATPWIAVLVAITFDHVLLAAWQKAQQRRIYSVLCAALILGGGAASADVLHNWRTLPQFGTTFSPVTPPLIELRTFQPTGLLSVYTRSFFDYLPFYETLTRAAFGSPDYQASSVPPTIRVSGSLSMLPRYGIQVYAREANRFEQAGYAPLRAYPQVNSPVLYEYSGALPYAFVAEISELQRGDYHNDPPKIIPVDDYSHNIDSIHITLSNYLPGTVLVLKETSFPGWHVRVNGKKAPLETVGGMIGLTLPDSPDGPPLHIVFAYRSIWLNFGAIISVMTAVCLMGYLLGADRPARRWRAWYNIG